MESFHGTLLLLQRAAGNASVARMCLQRQLGENVDLVNQEDRFFETVNRAQRLRVDSENDAYLEDIFREASLVSKTDEPLVDKLRFALDYFKKEIPYNKSGKIEAFAAHKQGEQEVRNLGTMLHAHSATCWEKAALFHLVLAEMGIASVLEGGYKKSSGVGHAWILLSGDLGTGIVLDPTWNQVNRRDKYEESYEITVPAKAVATPRVAVSADQLKTALAKLYSQQISATSHWELFVKPLIALKVDRLRHEAAIAKDRDEFDKLLERVFGWTKS